MKEMPHIIRMVCLAIVTPVVTTSIILLWTAGMVALPDSPGSPAAPLFQHLRNSPALFFGSGVALILLSAALSWRIARRVLSPLSAIGSGLAALRDGRFQEIPNTPPDDLFSPIHSRLLEAADGMRQRVGWYDGILDAVPDPISITDLEMRWVHINRAMEERVGSSRRRILGQKCTAWIDDGSHSGDAPPQRLQQGSAPVCLLEEASGRHFRLHRDWLMDDAGQRIGHIEIIQDVTETEKLKRKASENHWLSTGEAGLNEALRGESTTRELGKKVISFLCQHLNAASGAFYILREEEAILELSAAYAYMRRKQLSNRFHPGEGLVGQAFMEGNTILITDIPADYIRITSGLGHAPPRSVVVIPFSFEDQVIGVMELAAFHDFTELEVTFLDNTARQIGIAINTAQSRARMRTLLEQTREQAEALKLQQEKLRQTNEELEAQTKAIRASEASLQAQQEELRVTNEELEERTRTLERQRDEIRDKNLALETARREIEQKAKDLEIAGKYKSQFLANMSHELRTPLNSILILSQLIQDNPDGNLTEKQVEFARTIHSSGADLLSLINEILDLSKVEAGKLDIVVEEMGIAELIKNVRRTFDPIAAEKGLSFTTEVDKAVPEYIHTDAKRLWQVVKNLLSNAFKFTDAGSVHLLLTKPGVEEALPAPHLPPGRTIALSVSDTGIGIPADKQQMIFQAFHQADGTTSRKYGGTGLGLSISKGFARFLGGEIHLDSEPGRGSTFTLYLPVQIRQPAPQSAAPPAPVPDFAPETAAVPPDGPYQVKDDRRAIGRDEISILIVEDDPHFSKILIDLARSRGFKALLAEDGETGLHFADFYHPGAIILDARLPGMDGWTVMERLRANPKTRRIPVHVISASDQEEKAMALGAVGYLTKPVNRQALEQVFRHMEQIITRPVRHLLIVEDDAAQRRAIEAVLEGRQIEIAAVDSAAGAETALGTQAYDCMILDLGLSDMDGLSFLRRIRTLPNIPCPPVIVYTGRELTQEEAAEIRAAADRLVIKGMRSEQRLLEEVTGFLSRLEASPPVQGDLPDRKELKQNVLKGKSILIVDDDMRNVFALASVLENEGAVILEARNGIESLRMLDQNPDTDLVIMDIMMPEMDGYEAMRQIRSQPRFQELKIIALTAKAMKGDKSKCINAGANDYIAKPIDTDKLISLLRVWLY